MPSTSWSSIRAQRARITALDACGRPLPAATECGFAVITGFVSVAYSPQYDEQDPIRVPNANGDNCINAPGKSKLTGVNVELVMCGVDPDVVTLISGQEAVLNAGGDAVGNRLSEDIPSDVGWALETWTEVPGQACDATSGARNYGYFLLPWLGAGRLGDFTLQNDAANFTWSGTTKGGSGWDVGPWKVDETATAGTSGPLLTPIGPKDHLDMHLTTVAPPAETAGCQPMPATLPA